MNFTFTSKGIDSLEKNNGTPIANMLGSSALNVLVQFLIVGAGAASKDVALDMIDEYRASGKSTSALQMEIIEALEEQGFLDKALGFSAKIKKQMEKISKMDTLDGIGVNVNPLQ